MNERLVWTMERPSKRRQSGNAMIEFALCMTLLIPLFLGSVVVGISLRRSVQVTQVSRDAGHMFARWVDFSQPANQDLIVRLAQGLNMTRTGGNGVVILSKVMHIGSTECTAGGLTVGQCTNYNLSVIVQRIVIGNAGLRSSSFGTPGSGLLNSKGEVSNYLTESSARTTGFSNLLSLQIGELAYVSEAFFALPALRFSNYRAIEGVYARTFF